MKLSIQAADLFRTIRADIRQSNQIFGVKSNLADVTFVKNEFSGDYRAALDELIKANVVKADSFYIEVL
jgi:hypothetical protein